MPDSKEWLRFVMPFESNPGQGVPPVQSLPLLSRPWGSRASRGRMSWAQVEKNVVAALLICFLVAITWQASSLWKWSDYRVRQENFIHELSEKVEPLVTAREQAFKNLHRINMLLSLSPYPSVLEIWAAVLEREVGKNVEMVDVHYSDGRLGFTLRGKGLDPRFNVRSFEAHPFFHGVTVEKGRNPDELKVSMQVGKP